MNIKELIVELEDYENAFAHMLRRFVRTSEGLNMDRRDDPVYRQKILEIRDLLVDTGFREYSGQIVRFFNEGISNFLNSPSYASVERVIASLRALQTRLNRMSDKTKDLPVPKVGADVLNSQASRVFIGHGHSQTWIELKDFLVSRLGLDYEEFNREPAAGKSNKERLLEMLRTSGFALIVMTGEEETQGGERRPRENVIHEAGLFQGRLGFEKAIIILEEGCQEFSNINGLVQLRFPRGNIKAISEELRRTLEREGVITKSE
jgi:predicted nucleotide-binding protein